MQKRTFDLKTELYNLFSNYENKYGVQINCGNIVEGLFNLAVKNAGKKIDVVFNERDFVKLGSTVTMGLKKACAEFSTLVLESFESEQTVNKSFFNFRGDIVIAVGDNDFVSLTSYYSSIQKKQCYVVLTEPCYENILLNYVKIPINGVPLVIDITPIKEVFVDLDIISKAPIKAFSKAFISAMSKLVTLIDYKFKCLVTGKEFDYKSYQNIKKAISIVAGINSYENKRDVLIYAQAVFSIEKQSGEVLNASSIEMYADSLSILSPEVCEGERLLYAMRNVISIYEMFFTNDLFDLLTYPNYNEDIKRLEKNTGRASSYYLKNLNIPSPYRISIINKIIDKTRLGFRKEIESILFIMKAVENIFKSFYKIGENITAIPYSIKKEALIFSTYLSSEITILTHIRDVGVLNTLNG